MNTDGHYKQIEEFGLRVDTLSNGMLQFKVSHEQLVALHLVCTSLLSARSGALALPFGEIEARTGLLPALV